MASLRIVLVLAIALVCASRVLVFAAAAPAAANLSECQVKGAFLINFIRLIEWRDVSPGASTQMSVCVLGDSPIVPVLDSLAATPVKGKHVVVRRIAGVEEGMACDVL